MDRLLTRLERTFIGRLAIERLATYLVGGMAFSFILQSLRPQFVQHLVLIPDVLASQPWRLMTFLFLPPPYSMFWLILSMYFTWLIGTSLEQEWGTLKLNAYYFIGAAGTVLAGVLTGTVQTNHYLNISLYLAFATLFPDYEVRVFFVVPIKVKWLGVLEALFVARDFALHGLGDRAAIAVIVINYVLFFAGPMRARLRLRSSRGIRQGNLDAWRPPQASAAATASAFDRADAASNEPRPRVCAICGASQEDGADIRVCSCEACGGVPRELCLEHARNH